MKKYSSLEERMKILLESMRNNDISYSLILSSYKVDEYRPSTQIIEIIRKYEDKTRRCSRFYY
jgi:hypothetical protein